MKIRQLLVATTLALTCGAFAQGTAHKAADHKHMAAKGGSFEKWYRAGMPKMIKAMESKDMKFFESMASDDFTYEMMGQKSGRKEAMGQMKQMFDMASKVSYKYKALKFTESADSATVEGSQSMVMTMKAGKDKKKHVMTSSGKTHETWKKIGKDWKITSITETDSKMTMDGKPYDPMKGGK